MPQPFDLGLGQPTQIGKNQGESIQYNGMTTQSVYITMRDGVRLAAEVILPAKLPDGARIPTLLSQTRYWRAFELRTPYKWFMNPANLNKYFKDFQPFFTSRGYAIVIVDVRGTGASFGRWPYPWPPESIQDAEEIVNWIVAQPWSNGKVGAYGISYLGTTAELLMSLNHPAVKAVIPMFNHPDAYTDIAFPGGLFNKRFIKDWGYYDRILDNNIVPKEFGMMGKVLIKGVKPVDVDDGRHSLKAAVCEHATNGDIYPMARKVTYRDEVFPKKGICVENLTVNSLKEKIHSSSTVSCGWGSWMDAGTADAVIRRFLTFDNAKLGFIGAWEHGGRFNASPYRPTDGPAILDLSGQWQEMARFFDAFLKDLDTDSRESKVLHYYTMGEEIWKKTHVWPPKGTTIQRWYLVDGQMLSTTKPNTKSGTDAYKVDFKASTGKANRWWSMGAIYGKTVIYPNRRKAEKRLLTYTHPPLRLDTEITGYPVITLYVTSTEEDGAFIVYLEDVHPDGRVTYITEGQLRGIHRKVSKEQSPYRLQVPYHSFKADDAMPLVPGEIAELSFGLHPTSVLLQKGHRIRVAIAGHDKGTFKRIPKKGTPIITVARNRIFASYIDLPIVQRKKG